MYNPSYLFSRRGIFYFRIVVPARLRSALSGLTEFRCSLFTKDKKTALTKSRILSLQAERILNLAESLQMAMKQDPDRMGFIVKYNPKDGLYVESDPNNPEDGAQAIAAVQQLAPVIAAAEQSRPAIDAAEVMRLMHAANALSGFQPGTLNPNSSLSLSVVLEDYMKVNSAKWEPRTADDYRSSIRLFIDTVGDLPIQTVVKRTVADFKVAKSGSMAASTLDKKLVAVKGLLDYPTMAWNDWRDDAARNAALRDAFDYIGIDAVVQSDAKSALAHGRALEVKFKSGKSLTVRFDQGVSYWKVPLLPTNQRRMAGFAFQEDAKTQGKYIAEMRLPIVGSELPTEIFSKVRDRE